MLGRLNTTTYLLSVIGIIISGAVGVILRQQGQGLYEIVSAVGSVASLFGLAIAIVQLSSLKEISQETKRAVQETQDKLVQNISIADVSKAIKMIEQIQMHVGLKRYESAHLRLQDLKSLLIQFKQNSQFSKIAVESNYDDLYSDLIIHTLNIYDLVFLAGKELNSSVLNKTLENIGAILVSFENQLKFNRGE
jgi:DNA-binding protein